MSMALQLICDYSDSDENDNHCDDSTEITTKQLNDKSIQMSEADEEGILSQIKPVIELNSVEDIEKWKEERRKKFPKVPARANLEDTKIKEKLNSVMDVKDKCTESRGAKRKKGRWSSSSSSTAKTVSQRKLTLFEKVIGQSVT